MIKIPLLIFKCVLIWFLLAACFILKRKKKSSKILDILPPLFSTLQKFQYSLCVKLAASKFLSTYFSLLFKTHHRYKCHSCASQKLSSANLNQTKWPQWKVKSVSRWVSVGCKRPRIQGGNFPAVQASNHEFEQKGLLTGLCQKFSAGTLL